MKDDSTLVTYNGMRLFELWKIASGDVSDGAIVPIRSFKVKRYNDHGTHVILISYTYLARLMRHPFW